MKKKNSKGFDCIAFKREAQAKIYDEIKDFPPVEELKYLRQKVATGPFKEWWQSMKARYKKTETMVMAEDDENYGAG